MRRVHVFLLLVVCVLGVVGSVSCGSKPAAAGGGSNVQAVTTDTIIVFRYGGALSTNQDAIDAVLAFLQYEARSDAAGLYLAEYLMVANNRDATNTEDGLAWYATFTMDRKPDSSEGEKSYWSSAAWMVFKDGRVMNSSRHSGNANRILQDLRNASR